MVIRFIAFMTAFVLLTQALFAREETKDFEFYYYNHGDMSKLRVEFFNPFESQEMRIGMFDILLQRVETEAHRMLGSKEAEKAKLTAFTIKVLHEDFRTLRDAEACGRKSMIALFYDTSFKEREKQDFMGFVTLHHNLIIPDKDSYSLVIENAAFSKTYPETIYMRAISEIQDFLAELYDVESYQSPEEI